MSRPGNKTMESGAKGASLKPRARGPKFLRKLGYARWLPHYAWQRLARPSPRGVVHLIFVLADHFEPSIVPEDGRSHAPLAEQDRRVKRWCSEYPRAVQSWRDQEGRPFVHTYFFPAEQYDRGLVDRLAAHCHEGWGELEIHLHHGMDWPDTAENTRRQLVEFRDALVFNHGSLSFLDGSDQPRYAFVHGNFALANSAGGYACGVDTEMEILADTGCYADFTMPTAAFHPAQIGKVNSLYECALPLNEQAPHRKGRDLHHNRPLETFPIIVQGPLMLDFDKNARNRVGRFENAALTGVNPPSLRRLRLWKQAAISIQGRPDWIFIKLHSHSMDPTQEDAVMGGAMQRFLADLVEGAQERREILHFVTAREMTNIIWAACDGHEGNPGEYRNYRLKLVSESPARVSKGAPAQVSERA
ncbi:MAG TPA: hypothetical protein VH350_13280 [Candidatus Sulfotelmatobacter sp.]|nr:hypothetical protein [Candidatus Sulfotelmatobacter sp.]